MVKRMIVVLSALALIMTAAGMAGAWYPGYVMTGDIIMVPMKVTSKFVKSTGRGGFSSFFMHGCQQYTGGFRPWGTWRGTKCTLELKVTPPRCIAPAYGGPVAWGAPPPVAPGCALVKATEKYAISSPGCMPCVDGGMKYSMVKKQVVK